MHTLHPHRRAPTPPEVLEQRERERELKELDRDTRTVFAYNLNLKADEKDLFDFFTRAGTVRPLSNLPLKCCFTVSVQRPAPRWLSRTAHPCMPLSCRHVMSRRTAAPCGIDLTNVQARCCTWFRWRMCASSWTATHAAPRALPTLRWAPGSVCIYCASDTVPCAHSLDSRAPPALQGRDLHRLQQCTAHR